MTSGPRGRLAFPLLTAAYFAVLVVALFGPALLWRPRVVVSGADQDIDRQFFPWRSFAFAEWRRTGGPPAWNPYAFGGAPALGNPQYALLYPPNWVHFLLPTGWAINVIAAFHVWLAGVATAAWCRSRGASMLACLVGGTIFALCGPVMLHLYAGHLTYLCVIAWTPLVFVAADALVDRTRAAGVVIALGGCALAMQLLAGYPQPAFYTALLIVPYVTVRGSASRDERRVHAVARALTLLVAMYVLGAALAAAQLLPTLDAARESVRATPLTFEQASTYALPVENLLTLIVPYPFGDDFSAPYRGKWLMWETSIFVGGIACMLTMLSTWRPRRDRAVWTVLILAVLLALGGAAFHALYAIVPGVDRFRAPGRFAFLAALMFAARAAAGVDVLREANVRRAAIYAAAVVVALLAGVTSVRSAATGFVLAQLAMLLALVPRVPRLVYVVPLLVILEMWRPAARAVDWFTPRPMPAMLPPRWPDQRSVTTSATMLNQSVSIGMEDAWGYDPATSARWTDLVGPLLGADARQGDFTPTRDLAETRNDPLWRMIRVDNAAPPRPYVPPLPRALLVDDVRRVDSPAASLAAVRAEDFDPARVVVVEAGEDELGPYGITRGDGPIGDVTVVRRTADSLEITASVSRAAMLVVTDAYSAGWRVRPFDRGPQPVDVMPANHALRGVPLAAGRFHLVMEYRPPSIVIGRLVTFAAAVVTVGLVLKSWRTRERRDVPDPGSAPPVL